MPWIRKQALSYNDALNKRKKKAHKKPNEGRKKPVCENMKKGFFHPFLFSFSFFSSLYLSILSLSPHTFFFGCRSSIFTGCIDGTHFFMAILMRVFCTVSGVYNERFIGCVECVMHDNSNERGESAHDDHPPSLFISWWFLNLFSQNVTTTKGLNPFYFPKTQWKYQRFFFLIGIWCAQWSHKYGIGTSFIYQCSIVLGLLTSSFSMCFVRVNFHCKSTTIQKGFHLFQFCGNYIIGFCHRNHIDMPCVIPFTTLSLSARILSRFFLRLRRKKGSPNLYRNRIILFMLKCDRWANRILGVIIAKLRAFKMQKKNGGTAWIDWLVGLYFEEKGLKYGIGIAIVKWVIVS